MCIRDRGNSLTVNHALDALAGECLEFFGAGQFDATFFGAADDRLGERVFRATFQARREAQDLSLIHI